MDRVAIAGLAGPRFETAKELRIAGMRGRYTKETMGDVPALWRRFMPHIGKIPSQVGRTAYGLCLDDAGGFEYVAGVEVADFARVPGELDRVTVPAQRYAVFPHTDHVSTLRKTVEAIFRDWLPASGHTVARTRDGAPDFFERYGEGFDPQTGRGDIEIWIPLAA